jgi:hypothetical protein
MLSTFDLLEISKNLEKIINQEIKEMSISMFASDSQYSYDLYMQTRYQIEGMRMAIGLIKEELKEK